MDSLNLSMSFHVLKSRSMFGQLLFQDSGKTIHSAEKHYTSYKWAGFFTDMKQKKIQNGRLKKFKMAASKKPHFPAPPILNIFS